MKKILLFLFVLCSLSISAQDVVVRRNNTQRTAPKKQTTTTAKPKPSSTTSKPKPQSKPSVPSPIIGTSTYTPDVRTYTANGVSFRMVEVQGGTFNMGATSEQGSDVAYWEKPVHKVTLSDFYIGQTEVTQALWQAVMGSNPSWFKGSNLPVEKVTWNDCQTFISKLNSLTGQNFRLPTEAEWEFAARGGVKSNGYKYSGSNSKGNVAWCWANSGSATHQVGTKSPNELGIYDMSGNVYEWCSDRLGDYSSSAQTNPKGPNTGSIRVYRGGCWFGNTEKCRVSSRNTSNPVNGDNDLGLRLCLSK